MNYTCFTGGAMGSDFVWETESIKKGFKVVAFSFEGHNTKSRNRLILTPEELEEGFEHIKIANKKLNRNLTGLQPYVKNLIARDWFQVNSSDTIFAVGVSNSNIVLGGTGYAVACAMDNKKPIYLFDQNFNYWLYFDYKDDAFRMCEEMPKLTEKFAGIGTRNINNDGVRAIVGLFKNI